MPISLTSLVFQAHVGKRMYFLRMPILFCLRKKYASSQFVGSQF